MYYAKLLEQVKHGKGYWDTQRLGVFRKDNDEQVGEFHRNYSAYGEATFAPFERNGKWYALYSRKYTAISVMSLPDCTHLGGEEEGNSFGFCPVEIYIPRYQWWITKGITDPEELKKYPEQNHSRISKDRWEKQYDQDGDSCFCDDPNDEAYSESVSDRIGMESREIFYEDFAFVSGCHWGDDSSWKIEIRDISKAHEGIIAGIDDWGYYELPYNLKLKEAIRLDAFDQYDKQEETHVNITMAVTKIRRLYTHSKTFKDF